MRTRDFAVSVLVVRNARLLLHHHQRLNRWLPPGGHVDADELPDEAAIREVFEETGVRILLVGEQLNEIKSADQPRQLIRPLGIQLATIRGNHEHIDLVYLARGLSEGDSRASWFCHGELDALVLTEEVRQWSEIALSRLAENTEV